MAITPENITRHELIGLECRVMEHSDPGLEGVHGEVMDEKMKMLRVGDRWVEKKHGTFRFRLPSGEEVTVDGSEIAERPEDRI